MSKRASSSKPSTPKKRKLDPGQQSIASFFKSPQAKSCQHLTAPGKGKPHVIDLDEENPLSTAGAHKFENLEAAIVNSLKDGSGRQRSQGPPNVIEIIDVDESGDEDTGQMPITARSTTPCIGRQESANSRKLHLVRKSGGKPMVMPPLSVDPLKFALDELPWQAGEPATYALLTHALLTLTETRSRIKIIDTITNFLRILLKYDQAALLPALYLLSNSLSPPYISIELGLGPSIISKAVQQVSGLSPQALRRLYNLTGDPGDAAFKAKSNIRTLIPHPPLFIKSVFESLLKISHAKGQGAAKLKQGIVEKLLVAAEGEEVRFLGRTLAQNLRVGAVRTSMLTSLARAVVLTPAHDDIASTYYVEAQILEGVKPLLEDARKKDPDPAREEVLAKFVRAEGLLKRVFVQHPNHDHIVDALLKVGLDGLAEAVPLTLGIPLHPTLGSPTRSLDEIYNRLGDLDFAAEFKYDGQRAQIHATRHNGNKLTAKIFSRHLEDMTSKYPDVISMLETFFEVTSCSSFIIDSEIVAINDVDGSTRSFQELSNRARKDVIVQDVKITVCVFAFDLMYLNGQVLLEYPFRDRRQLLRDNLPPFTPLHRNSARFDHVESCESKDGRDAIQEFWERAVESRCEGLMIKLLDSGTIVESEGGKDGKTRRKPLPSTYEPDKRTSAWLKLKKDYVQGLGDSLDLVPIGAWHGNGRKAQWWSPILMAVYNPDSERFVAVCKCMSGFTDTFYKNMLLRYAEGSDNCSHEPKWDCDTGGLRPTVYFKPQEVWEIRGADITLSPVSVAALGIVSQERGLSLRFPRFIRIREDKGLENASSPEFLAGIWTSQQGNARSGGVDEGDLMDVDVEDEDIDDDDFE